MQDEVWWLYIFFHNHNYPEGTGEFIYKSSILDNRQLLSSMIDREVTQVPYTNRNVFLTDSYIFCYNHPAIFCFIAIASYIAIWRQNFEQSSKYIPNNIAGLLAKW